MTVKELMEKLAEQDPNTLVIFDNMNLNWPVDITTVLRTNSYAQCYNIPEVILIQGLFIPPISNRCTKG